jgi:hypothetical protein
VTSAGPLNGSPLTPSSPLGSSFSDAQRSENPDEPAAPLGLRVRPEDDGGEAHASAPHILPHLPLPFSVRHSRTRSDPRTQTNLRLRWVFGSGPKMTVERCTQAHHTSCLTSRSPLGPSFSDAQRSENPDEPAAPLGLRVRPEDDGGEAHASAPHILPHLPLPSRLVILGRAAIREPRQGPGSAGSSAQARR